ncbi:hypothetical protein DFP72DRAFT_841469 [Ephemerocybe angulata]|uniref:Uncharacterized protein n=1 Tax=Ephemerocybe angulata TaxID=980116 RepID=A0A8H6IDA2_9AGAR|nr:hypothetical protein DFP72DRAFT_841469 [Tulosesus angulatus]
MSGHDNPHSPIPVLTSSPFPLEQRRPPRRMKATVRETNTNDTLTYQVMPATKTLECRQVDERSVVVNDRAHHYPAPFALPHPPPNTAQQLKLARMKSTGCATCAVLQAKEIARSCKAMGGAQQRDHQGQNPSALSTTMPHAIDDGLAWRWTASGWVGDIACLEVQRLTSLLEVVTPPNYHPTSPSSHSHIHPTSKSRFTTTSSTHTRTHPKILDIPSQRKFLVHSVLGGWGECQEGAVTSDVPRMGLSWEFGGFAELRVWGMVYGGMRIGWLVGLVGVAGQRRSGRARAQASAAYQLQCDDACTIAFRNYYIARPYPVHTESATLPTKISSRVGDRGPLHLLTRRPRKIQFTTNFVSLHRLGIKC